MVSFEGSVSEQQYVIAHLSMWGKKNGIFINNDVVAMLMQGLGNNDFIV